MNQIGFVIVDGKPIVSEYTPDEIRQATKAFKKHTSIGSDNLCFQFVRRLPDVALESLGSIMTVSKKLILPPLQMLQNMMAAIPKKTGDTRTIAIASTLYRLLMQLDHREIERFEEANIYVFDSARKGTSATRPTLHCPAQDQGRKSGISVGRQLLLDRSVLRPCKRARMLRTGRS